MHIVLKHTPNRTASLFDRVVAKVIKYVLNSNYFHSGVVIDGFLYHSDFGVGLTKEPFNNEGNWDLFYCGTEDDSKVIEQFNNRLKAAGGHVGYDWFSLFAFTPLFLIAKLFKSDITYVKWLYCFEWNLEVLTQQSTKTKVTPEKVLIAYIKKYGNNYGKQ